MFNLSPVYSAQSHQTTKDPKTTKSVLTQIYRKHVCFKDQTKTFQKKHISLGHAGIVDHSVDL